jgi:hypothetical protein
MLAALTPLAAADYPMTLVVDARAKTANATVTSSVTIQVDRLMEESRRKRVADALRYGGYPNFLPALRALPPIGTVSIDKRSVEIKYAVETTDQEGKRLVIVADRPLIFLTADTSLNRAGYELTLIELRFDASGKAAGRMMGAARVKPLGDGEVGLDAFADVQVELTEQQK